MTENGLTKEELRAWRDKLKEQYPDKTEEELLDYIEAQTKEPDNTRRTKTARTGSFNPARVEDQGNGENIDLSDYFRERNGELYKALDERGRWRGISKETLDRFNVGYAAPWRDPRPGFKTWLPAAVVIPTSKKTFIARNTDPKASKEYKVRKNKPVCLFNFNRDDLRQQQPVFVVEGEIDALSLEDLGYKAIGLGGVGEIRKLSEALARAKNSLQSVLYIALDNDSTGKDAGLQLSRDLNSKGIKNIYVPDLYGDAKDANEILQRDRGELRAKVEAILARFPPTAEGAYKAEHNAKQYLTAIFADELKARANTPPLKTGFKHLDKLLGGGLHEGMIAISASSGLGKTTFVLQLADQIAALNSTDILYFALEQSTTELIAKSLSRNSYIAVREEGLQQAALTEYDITDMYTPEKAQSAARAPILGKAMARYGSYADHVYFFEGIGNIGPAEIRKNIEKHIGIEDNSQHPVVIVDYLQLLAPDGKNMTDKQAVDKNILELKRISRDFRLPVVLISSVNRGAYYGEVQLDSSKESGAIEFTCDAVIGLQYDGVEDGDDSKTKKANKQTIKEQLQEEERQVVLRILKNRHGRHGELAYKFVSAFNYFAELPYQFKAEKEKHTRVI